MPKKKLGLIVNPIAGLGGRVGLHGSDGVEVQKRALALGAVPEANRRAAQSLARLDAIRPEMETEVEIVTCPGEMGESAARSCGFTPRLAAPTSYLTARAVEFAAEPSAQTVGQDREAQSGGLDAAGLPGATTAQDTIVAVEAMRRLGVDLLLFAGGDGTARDVCRAAEGLTVLGIPAGVKIHSAVFAVNARGAGDLAVSYLRGSLPRTREAEVVDLDEELFRQGIISTRLFGYLTIPAEPRMLQGAKTPSRASEQEAQAGIAARVAAEMNGDTLYILGPGTTTRAIAARLGLSKTLVGVDVVFNGKIIAADANEQEVLGLLSERSGRIIVTPVGGQGCLFGRGNQQLSPNVIKKVGKDNLIVVATPDKIQALAGRPLWVDTGDQETDRMLAGFVRVITGYRDSAIYMVAAR